jgi:hypothetical protein
LNIRQRINAVMKELQGVELVRAQGLKFKIIQHDDVTAALRPLYLKHGIDQEVSVMESRQLEGGTTELLVRVAWINIDDPVDQKCVLGIGHATSHADKATGHLRRDDLGVGKALSYAVKMAQLKNFALLSGDEDLETAGAKQPEKQAEPSNAETIERVMNMLASVETPAQFKVAANACSELTGLSAEQNKLMGAAWKAAKDRSENPQKSAPLPKELGEEEERPAQREQSTAEKITGQPGVGLSAHEMQELQRGYSNVRDEQLLARVNADVQKVLKQASPAQKQLLKESYESAVKLLRMQQEASR